MSRLSPRDILLARHRAAVPELDRARAAALAIAFPRIAPVSLLAVFWRDVFLTYRSTWCGLAAVWLILAALHFSNPLVGPVRKLDSPIAGDDLLAAWDRQRRLLAEISPVNETLPSPPPPAPKAKSPGRTSAAGRSSHHV
jgi:hypothetical protein